MDIILLRQTLKELNPFFWNASIDSQLKDSKFPNRSPVESAIFRHTTVTLRNEKGKNRIKDLFKEVEKCLIPYPKAYEVLLKEFPNQFAQELLFTNEKLIQNFTGASNENCNNWRALVVCMSHKDFWADLASTQQKETEKPAEPDSQQGKIGFLGELTPEDPSES